MLVKWERLRKRTLHNCKGLRAYLNLLTSADGFAFQRP